MIEAAGITHYYDSRPALLDVDLKIERGELVAVVGPNGMGKSTLLGILGGVLAPLSGWVTIGGRRRRGSVDDELAIRKMAVFLPDRPWLPAVRTPREFLYAVGRLYAVEHDRLVEHLDRLLGLFELTEKAEASIRSCSAGQQKKVALCSALITDAPVLFLDEPFSGGLDPSGLVALKRVLKRRVEKDGFTVVLASPIPELVEEIATRIVVLSRGRVIAFDTLEGLRRSTGVAGSLSEVLEKLMFPEAARRIEGYFEGPRR